ncbi:MAG: hypothetical protein M3M94_00715 [Actinomycetota bacterium]|nr:hypothetical protein [Actinomycetota bacterium]
MEPEDEQIGIPRWLVVGVVLEAAVLVLAVRAGHIVKAVIAAVFLLPTLALLALFIFAARDELSTAGRVWNRATDHAFKPQREGDSLLKAAIAFHGLTADEGLARSLEVLDSDEMWAAVAALHRFGLHGAARVVEEAVALGDEGARANMTDDYLKAARSFRRSFGRYYAEHPDEFEPPPERRHGGRRWHLRARS